MKADKFCDKCGCYIPNNWNYCPSCGEEEKHEERKGNEPYINIGDNNTLNNVTLRV